MRKTVLKKALNLIEEHKSLEEICKELGEKEDMFILGMKEEGYIYNDKNKKFEHKDNISVNKNDEESNKKVIKNDYKSNNKVTKKDADNNINIIESDEESNIKLSEVALDLDRTFTSDEISNIKVLLKYYDDIISLIEKKPVILDLPKEKDQYRTTIAVNKKIWDEFTKKCDSLRYYDRKDLVSLALQDFIKKY